MEKDSTAELQRGQAIDGISIHLSERLALVGFVDSDYAKDSDKEVEYMALTEAVKEAIWLRGLLEELGVELNTVAVNVIIRTRCTYRGIMFFMKGLSTSMCVITLSERS
nr:hypothetical protein [Tanacetum cinerariifolium]